MKDMQGSLCPLPSIGTRSTRLEPTQKGLSDALQRSLGQMTSFCQFQDGCLNHLNSGKNPGMSLGDLGNRPGISILLEVIDQAYNRKSWHGTNLRGSLRNVTAEEAAWRPGPGRHNIWELVVHAAYWKYAVHRRLVGQPAGSFGAKGSNWFERPQDAVTEAAFKRDVAMLDGIHRSLRAAIASLSPKALPHIPTGVKTSNQFLITGIAAHDLYHAGQIQLLKRLQRI